LVQWVGVGVSSFAAVITLCAVVVALSREELRRVCWKPRLAVKVNLGPPDCHHILLNRTIDAYYLHLKIQNSGNRRAEKTEVFVAELSQWQPDSSSFEPVNRFLPMNLLWSHSENVVFTDVIAPDMAKHCNLGHIIHPEHAEACGETLPDVPKGQLVFSFELQSKPFHGCHLVGPGIYRLTLQIAETNVVEKPVRLELTVPEKWDFDKEKMLLRGLDLRKVN
jgi:hypothetical protein